MAKHASGASSVELSHYLTVLRRRWKAVVVGIVLGVGVATVLALVLPSQATARTEVNVNLISSNAFNSQRPASDLLDLQTEQAMARSTAVMSEVAEALGDDWTTSAVRGATQAALLPDGTVLRIEFTARDAEEAATGSELVAQAYLDYRSDQAQGRVDVASERLTARRTTLNRQLAQANLKIAEAPDSGAARNAAEMERQGIADELSGVTTELNELRAVDTSGGAVLTEADPDQAEMSPNRPLIMTSGIFGGALLGLVLAFVANVLDRRVRDPYDVFGAGGGITVAHLADPEAAVPAEREDADLLRAVRERLLSTAASDRVVFSVVDVGSRTALPSDVATNLAVALADSGMSTDLVLADYPQEVLNEVLAALRVTEVEPVGVSRCFRDGFDSSLRVLVPSPVGQRLSTADVVSDLLADGVRAAEATVVGVAPGAGPAVRLSAGRASDQVVLVVEEMTTRIDGLAEAASDLLAVQAEIHGTVLVPRGRQLAGLAEPGAMTARSTPPPLVTTHPEASDAAGTDEVAQDADEEPEPAPVAEQVTEEQAVEEQATEVEATDEVESTDEVEATDEVEPTDEAEDVPTSGDTEVADQEESDESTEADETPVTDEGDDPSETDETEKPAGVDVQALSAPPDTPVVANENSWAFTR